MPNIITHTLFAQEIFDKVDENTHDLFEPRLHLLEIGSNGPDFLFFHGMNPKDFFKKSDLRVSGSMFHAGHVNEFYQKALISIRNEADEEIKKDFEVLNDSFPTIYRIDRIRELKILDEKFFIPYRNRFEEGEFRKRIQFMYGGKLRNVKFKYTGDDIDAILDRLPTAQILEEGKGYYIVKAEVFGKGIDMWLRSQGDKVEVMG